MSELSKAAEGGSGMLRILDMKTVSDDGKWIVSTVALADPSVRVLDMIFAPERLADTFETMVFTTSPDGKVADFADHYRCGYSEITEARIGHEIAVATLNRGALELY